MAEIDTNIQALRDSVRDPLPLVPLGDVRNITLSVYHGETWFADYQEFRHKDWHSVRAFVNWNEPSAMLPQHNRLYDGFRTLCALQDCGITTTRRCSVIPEKTSTPEQRFSVIHTEQNLWLLWQNLIIRGYRLKHSTIQCATWSFPTVGKNHLTMNIQQINQMLGN